MSACCFRFVVVLGSGPASHTGKCWTGVERVALQPQRCNKPNLARQPSVRKRRSGGCPRKKGVNDAPFAARIATLIAPKGRDSLPTHQLSGPIHWNSTTTATYYMWFILVIFRTATPPWCTARQSPRKTGFKGRSESRLPPKNFVNNHSQSAHGVGVRHRHIRLLLPRRASPGFTRWRFANRAASPRISPF